MKRLSFVSGSVVLFLAGFVSVSLSAQAPAPAQGTAPAAPPPAKNLQVLPKEWTTAQVLPVMRGIVAALGTECGHCHVWTGPGAPGNDFPAEGRPKKPKPPARVK